MESGFNRHISYQISADLNLSHEQWKSLLESFADVNGIENLDLLSIRSFHQQRTDVRKMLHRNIVQHLLYHQHTHKLNIALTLLAHITGASARCELLQ